MKYELSNLIDIEKNQRLLDSFCDAIGIAAAIIDLEGEVLVGSRWQRICTDFHRVNKWTCERCIESDTELTNELQQGKRFSIYQCRNGLTDAASPIIIEGEHIANVFVGQFLLKTPNREFFCQQADSYGFEETAYLEALSEVPIVPEENLPPILDFLTSFAEMVGQMGLEHLKQIETEEALRESEEKYRTILESIEEALRASERFLQNVFDGIQDGISVLDRDLTITGCNFWIEDRYAERMPLVGKKCYKVYQGLQSPCPWCPAIPAIETGEKSIPRLFPIPLLRSQASG